MAYKAAGKVSSYTDLELALMCILSVYGNGQTRKNNLGSRYAAVQGLVNRCVTGTIPAGSGSGKVSPEKLAAAIDKTFNETMKDLRKEIVENYD